MKLITVASLFVFSLGAGSALAKSTVLKAAGASQSLSEVSKAAASSPTSAKSETREIISTPQDYLRAMKRPEKAGKIEVRGLVGRVLKGKADKDFETLSNDPSRKIIFLMGGDGLEELVGLSNDQILVKIGYTPEYIDRLKREGHKFKLVVFKTKGEDGQLGTWDNVARLVGKQYPSIAAKVSSAIPELKKSTFSSIEAQAPSRFSSIDKVGKNHPDYIDEARLEKSEGKLWEVRGFLYFRTRLMDLYAGDGYTRDAEGEKGLREYIAPNKPIRELSGAVLADLHE